MHKFTKKNPEKKTDIIRDQAFYVVVYSRINYSNNFQLGPVQSFSGFLNVWNNSSLAFRVQVNWFQICRNNNVTLLSSKFK